MKCPFCSYEDTKVIDSRSQEDNSVIRRRRLCEKCGKRFTTYERIDTIPLTVIKKDNTREQFDKTKLLNGIMKSCYKRPVSVHQMELLVENIENAITNSERKEIESQKIGDMVIEELKNLDEVSYVRFASVYRQFKDINTFREALEKIVNEKYDLNLKIRKSSFGVYIIGIKYIEEKICGNSSGWMYSVNDNFPGQNAGSYRLKDGDNIKWRFTCKPNDLK